NFCRQFPIITEPEARASKPVDRTPDGCAPQWAFHAPSPRAQCVSPSGSENACRAAERKSMSRELIVSVNGREKKIAIVENERVTEFYIERGHENEGIVGNLYKGRVMRVLPGMQSAF